MTKRLAISTTALLAGAFLMSGCGAADQPVAAPATVTNTATVTQPAETVTVTPEPTTEAPTPTQAPTTTKQAPTTTGEVDVTQKLVKANPRQPWLAKVVTATQTEPGRIEVETTVVDPRGRNGSPAAIEAIRVCRAVVKMMEKDGVTAPRVSIKEGDGTTFVLYGHPMAKPGICTEV